MDKIVKTLRFTHCYGKVLKISMTIKLSTIKNPKEWANYFCVSLLHSLSFIRKGTEVIIFLNPEENSHHQRAAKRLFFRFCFRNWWVKKVNSFSVEVNSWCGGQGFMGFCDCSKLF